MVKRVTIRDVAREAGVSIALVSFVMNRHNRRADGKEYRVNEDTVKRILEVAERLDYHPNVAASSLRSGKTLTPVDMPGLVDGVKALQADHPEIPVVIAADKTVRYEEVVNVMKTLQSADVQRVGLSLRIERSADAR